MDYTTHRLSDANNYLVHGFTALFPGVGTGLLHRPYVIIGANNRHQKKSSVGSGTFLGLQYQ